MTGYPRRLVLALALIVLVPAVAWADVGDNAVGMNVHDGRTTFIDASADLGVHWVRMDANWFQMEPSDGTYNWYLDNAVQEASAAGIQVFVTLAYTPQWVQRQGDTDGEFHNDIPATQDWVDFVTVSVQHYRALGVTHFGLWNEPNLDHFFEGTAQQYVDVIAVPGAAAVRSACSQWGDCKVLGPDLANVGDVDVFFEGVMTRAPIATWDIVTHHLYQGFPETGVQVWDGDRYFNVLDQPRVPGITRRSVREILDQAGWTGEVWITETGYRAGNIGNADDEQTQATYVTLALDEQLRRDWITATFIYEIFDCKPDQPTCDIDGFGLMRATAGSPGSRTFPTDFRLKPAFDALKAYILNHGEFDATPPTTACNDGIDNDGDGAIDLDDGGCDAPGDDNEADGPAREQLAAYRGDVVIDGDVSEFGDAGWVELDRINHLVGFDVILDDADLHARAAARWAPNQLYLAIVVQDDVHINSFGEAELWRGDSVQLGFDIGQSGGWGYDNVDDHELNFGLASGSVVTYRFHGPNGATDDYEAAITHAGGVTTYEIRVGGMAIPGTVFADGNTIGFSFVINEADEVERSSWLEWTSGIGSSKVPRLFGEIAFLTDTVPPVDSVEPVADQGTDTGPGSDTGSVGDTSTAGDTAGSDVTVGNDTTGIPGVDAGSDMGRLDTSAGGGGDDGGCGCQIAVQRSTPWGLLLGIGMVAFGLVRRRRRLG